MKITFAAGAAPADAAIVLAFASSELSAPAAELDEAAGGALSRAIKASRFEGKPGQSLELLAPAGVDYQRVVLLGVGKLGDLDAGAAEKIGAAAVRAVLLSGAKSACLRFDGTGLEADDCARAGLGAMLAAYRFDAYRSKLSDDKKPSLGALKISVEDAAAPRKSWKRYDAVAQGAAFARDLVSEPANVLYPEEFAKRLVALEKLGLKVDVLNEAEMTKLNMHALLGVGRGSRRQSQLVVMRWEGGDKSTPPLAVVGKGVCFDTGGISLKPGDGMWDMKGDMGGAAAVSGLMMALALKGAKANVVGVVGLVENMPDGDAMRPGDIVTSASGQTIEVLNTDAEGRLVLADALWYAREHVKPDAIIDLATLTGAMIITLGNEYAGVFSNNDDLADALIAAGKAADEPVWRMPMGPAYDKLIDTKNADMKNIGGRYAGSITAAQFLKRFVEDTPWAHLDIAPTAWKASSEDPREPVWATGWGVRMLERYVADTREK